MIGSWLICLVYLSANQAGNELGRVFASPSEYKLLTFDSNCHLECQNIHLSGKCVNIGFLCNIFTIFEIANRINVKHKVKFIFLLVNLP